ncbi:deoxynucleoside kinase [Candidatus Uhrbacteria bacterium]|nr:deoxynucleoside kinase [Candidatus Uhrbacteria bacterium]
MIDGIAGSGKSTVLRAVQTWAESCHHKIFRLSQWEDVEPPKFEQISNYDVYFTYEPTRTWIGRAIRYELSREDKPYDGETLAHAFALDRQIMYRRLIIPAIKAGKTIIQDRGVSTSLVYQPIMQNSLPLETVKNLPGNKLSLEYAPNALILTKLSAETAAERIAKRDDDSKGVFGQLEFLKILEQRFEERWLKELFESHGTHIYSLDMSGTIEETSDRAQKLITIILSTC